MRSDSTTASTRLGHCRRCRVALRPWQRVCCSEACYQAIRLTLLAERFWPFVTKADGCWLWSGARTANGYGQIGFEGHVLYAHRVAWEVTNGPIPDGLVIRHHCDTPACVRPEHLTPGTPAQNVRDAVWRGRMRRINDLSPGVPGQDKCPPARHARGERVGSARLTAEAVREIRRLYATGEVNQDTLAERFNVHQTTISIVVLRKRWHHVD